MADIDKLSIQISSNSSSAVSGLNALSSTLDKLKNATKGGLGLSSVANQVKKLSDSANGVNSTTIANLKGLADGMKKLSEIGDVKISSSIANQITKINTALSGLNIGDGANKINELVTALKPLETLGKSNLGSMVTSLKKLPETLQGLQSLDMGAFKSKIQEVTEVMKPLADEMQKVANGFNAFPNRIQKLIQENEKLSTSNNKASKSYINLYAKLKMAYQGIKTAAQTIGNCINLSNKYIEDMNLFNASMGEFAGEAREYAEKVGDIMGIDPGEWMRNQGVFMTLATGFGVVGERANIMSKNLTQLGYDLSSFFNISYEDAMLKLQSGLAGELEPLRRIGYDLSVARLQQEAYTLGINKKVSAMTQAEKAELRYYAIMTQVTTAQGDMARTLDAPANQLRILKSQVTQAGRAIGNIFIPLLNAVLPYLIAATKIVRILANAIASLFGFKLPEVDYSGLSSGASNYSEALDNATDSAKKLQKYTMGFDELNVIDPNQGSGSGSDASSGSGLGFDLPEYDFLGNATESRVGQIVDKMKEWLGITDDINTWSDLLNTRLGRILTLVGLIGGGFLAWKLTTGFISAITTLTTLLATPTYAIALGLTLTVTGFAIEYDGLKDAVTNGLNGFNFAEIIGGAILGVGGAALLGKMIVTWIGKVCSTKVAFVLARLGMKLGVETTGALGATLGAGIAGIIAGIPMFFVGIYDACKDGLDWLSGLLIEAGATLTGAGIGLLIGGPVGAGIGALIGLAVGALTDLVIAIVQNWGNIAEWFDTKVITPIKNFFVNLWNDISGVWNTVATWFDENVIQPVSSLFSTVTDWIGTFFEGCWIIIQAVWIVASTWFNENVTTPVSNFFKGLWEDVSGFFKQLWEDIKLVWQTVSTWFSENVTQPVKQLFETLWNDIKNVWSTVSAWFDENVITPVRNAWETATTKIGEFFSTLWAGIKSGVVDAMNAVIGGIESAINWVIEGINKLISGFNDIVDIAADIVGTDWGGLAEIPTVTLTRITKYETGGFPDAGEMFIAREAGPELVGSIGRKTAVANNEQIVASVSRGVAEANSEQNTLLREQNSLLRALLEKEGNTYLDGKKITSSVEKHQRERGRTILVGGVS